MFLDRFVAAGLLVTAPASVTAAERLGPYRAQVERVLDGDTLAVRVAIWLGQELHVLVRVRGIDAPEMKGGCASEKARAADARAALEAIAGGREVMLTGIEGDKYFGRVVADVATIAGEDMGVLMVGGGHARPYAGGRRGSWCALGGAPGAREELAQARGGT